MIKLKVKKKVKKNEADKEDAIYLIREFTPSCAICGEGDYVWGRGHKDIAEKLVEKGWRATLDGCYVCPDCMYGLHHKTISRGVFDEVLECRELEEQ